MNLELREIVRVVHPLMTKPVRAGIQHRIPYKDSGNVCFPARQNLKVDVPHRIARPGLTVHWHELGPQLHSVSRLHVSI